MTLKIRSLATKITQMLITEILHAGAWILVPVHGCLEPTGNNQQQFLSTTQCGLKPNNKS